MEPVELTSGAVLGGDLWKGLEDPLAVHGISEPESSSHVGHEGSAVGFHAEHGGVEFRWCHVGHLQLETGVGSKKRSRSIGKPSGPLTDSSSGREK